MSNDIILEIGKYAAALAAIIGLVVMLFKFVFLKPLKIFIKETVEDSTRPIQKGSNGGMSLPDANRKLNALDKRIDGLEESHTQMIATQEQILELLTKPKPRGRPHKTTE
jgi:hypothetical protein